MSGLYVCEDEVFWQLTRKENHKQARKTAFKNTHLIDVVLTWHVRWPTPRAKCVHVPKDVVIRATEGQAHLFGM